MNKKLVGVSVIFFLLLSSISFAASYDSSFLKSNDSPYKLIVGKNLKVVEHYNGVNNITLTIISNESESNINKVFVKVKPSDKLGFNHLEGVTFSEGKNNSVNAHGLVNSKLFGFIPAKERMVFVINNDGSVTAKKKFWNVFFKETNVSETVG